MSSQTLIECFPVNGPKWAGPMEPQEAGEVVRTEAGELTASKCYNTHRWVRPSCAADTSLVWPPKTRPEWPHSCDHRRVKSEGYFFSGCFCVWLLYATDFNLITLELIKKSATCFFKAELKCCYQMFLFRRQQQL